MSRQRHKRNKSLSLYIWHRYAGLSAAIFVIFITITGIALNHTDDLTLKNRHISTGFLLSHYSVKAPVVITRFKTASHTITQADDKLFINDSKAFSIRSPLTGATPYFEFTVIALTDKLLLTDSSNSIIQTLDELDGVPKNITNIGIDEQQRINVLADNHTFLLTGNLVLTSTPFNHNIAWSKPSAVSAADTEAISAQYKSGIISWETLILDIHSGRFFGSYGALFFDVVGIVLLFLAFTGIIIWSRQRTKKH
ncbi:MAG: hypothetical protein A6F72_02050 [Cycloclasticus sp. symbiont of Poecilosclerida sp. N]|nr:MAG: hypothetical protein A6F72_02050 [Cycloclasticus sp. symbiont of Poecilosclerida sp. N]